MNIRTVLMAISSAALVFTLFADTSYTSANYVQSGLIAQWDGIDNQGTGTHDPNATTWKDLKGSNDMTLTSKGSWTSDGKALYVDGMGAQGASATPAYKTIEIVYKMTKDGGRLIFVSGLQSRFVVMDPTANNATLKRVYFNGYGTSSGNDKYFNWQLDTTRIYSAAATYKGDSNVSSETGSHVKDVYGDGVFRNDGTMGNGWGVGNGKVAVGDRTLTAAYPWTGNVYAIRLYDRELTMDEIAANRAIDYARFMAEEVEPLPIPEYVQDGLIVQWDAADNAGTGTHVPTATAWKDLKGNYDLTLTNNAAWNSAGNALVVDGVSAVNANTLPAYQTIEVVYKMTSKGGRILLNSGDRSRMFIFDGVDSTRSLHYFSADTQSDNSVVTKYFIRTYSSAEICFDAAVYDGGDIVESLFSDGKYGNDGTKGNRWNPGPGVSIGGRVTSSPNSWYGEVYTIRLYNRRLTKAELAHNNRIDRRRFTSLENYEGRDSLIAQWDGEYNSGKGSAHNSDSTIWKDLRGTYDLTLTNNAAWNAAGNGLVVSGASAYNAYPAPVGRTFEIAYCKTDAAGRILFSCGNPSRQMIVSSGDGVYEYFSGLSGDQPRVKWSSFSSTAVRTLAATYTNTSAFAEFVYGDGTKRSNGTLNDSWSSNQPKLIVGDNTLASVYRPWYGEVYAIRFYSTELTAEQIAANSGLDKKRVALGAKTVAWGGSDGDFGTKANWTGSALPRYMDKAEISSGTASITNEQVVGALTLGAGAAVSLAVPEDAGGAVPLTVLGGVTADAAAAIVLDAQAFGKKHPGESVTLVECEKDSTAALQVLADNLSFVNTGKGRQGALAVVEGKKLVYTAPHRSSTTIVIQ